MIAQHYESQDWADPTTCISIVATSQTREEDLIYLCQCHSLYLVVGVSNKSSFFGLLNKIGGISGTRASKSATGAA